MGRQHRYRRRIPPPPELIEGDEVTPEMIEADRAFLHWLVTYPEALPPESRHKIAKMQEDDARLRALEEEYARAEQELARIRARRVLLQRATDVMRMEARARAFGLGGGFQPVRHLVDDLPDA